MKCFQTHACCCEVSRLLHQLHIPVQEQVALCSMASKKMSRENFKRILLFLQGQPAYGGNRSSPVKN